MFVKKQWNSTKNWPANRQFEKLGTQYRVTSKENVQEVLR
jgi:hypothetical protein